MTLWHLSANRQYQRIKNMSQAANTYAAVLTATSVGSRRQRNDLDKTAKLYIYIYIYIYIDNLAALLVFLYIYIYIYIVDLCLTLNVSLF